MKTIKYLAHIMSLAALGLFTLAAPRAAAADVPFHVDGTFTFTNLKGQTFVISGDGQGAPVGPFTFLGEVGLEYGGKEIEGMFTFFFASGSTLTFCYEGPIDEAKVVLGVFEVVDGTGLFEGASGSGIIWYPIGQGEPFTMDGTLSW